MQVKLKTSAILLTCFLLATLLSKPNYRQYSKPSNSSEGFLRPFSLSAVTIEDDDFVVGAELNHEYLLMLEVDNLMYNFRTTAGLDAPGHSYGGWEAPDMEVRGQFIGHCLSALAFAYKSTGRDEFYQRSVAMVDALGQVQDVWGDGYLNAFPKSFFDRLESLQPVWVPYYVTHKIMAGMLDQYQLVGLTKAFDIVKSMSLYYCGRVRNVIQVNGTEHWYKVLETEFGGMEEVLYNLAIETGDALHSECASYFVKPFFYDPLVEGKDSLINRHANTHLAQLNGFAAHYEASNDENAAKAAENAFSLLATHHSFSTAGSNWFEFWHTEDTLADPIEDSEAGASTQESCTQYNILKLARSVFRWSGSAQIADFYERAILNGVLGIQRKPHKHHHHDGSINHKSRSLHVHYTSNTALEGNKSNNSSSSDVFVGRPENYKVASWPGARPHAAGPPSLLSEASEQHKEVVGGPGVYIYFTPLSAATWKGDTTHGWSHGWGDAFNTFWCCYGTAVESFAKLADSIYFYRMNTHSRKVSTSSSSTTSITDGDLLDPPEIFVNQLTSSSVNWKELGVTIKQVSDLYPVGDNIVRSTLTVALSQEEAENSEQVYSDDDHEEKTKEFALQWRVPSWVKTDTNNNQLITFRVKSRHSHSFEALDVSLLPTFYAKGPRARSQARDVNFLNDGKAIVVESALPDFGGTSRYITVHRHWKHGEVLQVEMEMAIRTEGINDSRPEKHDLKAIFMGPFVMAGLTTEGRDVAVDPERISEAVKPAPLMDTLISLSSFKVSGVGEEKMVLSQETAVVRNAKKGINDSTTRQFNTVWQSVEETNDSRVKALAATFQLHDINNNHNDGDDVGKNNRAEMNQEVVVESLVTPGLYLTLTQEGDYVLAPLNQSDGTLRQEESSKHQVFFVVTEHRESGSFQQEQRYLIPAFSSPTPLTRTKGAKKGLISVKSRGSTLVVQEPAASKLPRGVRLLQGDDGSKSYLLMPIGQIVDEYYTAYFEFVRPSVGFAAV